MEHMNVAEKFLSILIENDQNDQINMLINRQDSEEQLIESLCNLYTSIECTLGKSELIEDVMQAILKIRSGKIMNRAKKVIGHGKWKYYAMDLFDIDESERNIRMKAASIVGIENYLYLGWKRISTLAKAVKRKTKRSNDPDPFKEIMKSISYMIDPQDPDDFEHFECLVYAYVIRNDFSAKLQKSISFETMVDAIECGVSFDNSFIKKLESSGNPNTSLRNYMYYESLELNPVYVPKKHDAKRRELSAVMNKLSYIGSMVIQNAEEYLKSIPIESFDKCFDVSKTLRDMKYADMKGA